MEIEMNVGACCRPCALDHPAEMSFEVIAIDEVAIFPCVCDMLSSIIVIKSRFLIVKKSSEKEIRACSLGHFRIGAKASRTGEGANSRSSKELCASGALLTHACIYVCAFIQPSPVTLKFPQPPCSPTSHASTDGTSSSLGSRCSAGGRWQSSVRRALLCL